MERDKIVKNIGKLKGKLLVFGGVYSNFQSLQKMKEIAEDLKIPASNVICTGDIVGYCAQPQECIDLIKSWGIHSIAGNVEIQLREGEVDCGCDFKNGSRCDVFSRRWYPYAQQNLNQSAIEWMKTLPDFLSFRYADRTGTVVHGSWFETAEYIFKSTPWEIKQKNFYESNSELLLAGHCGLPFSEKHNGHHWLNAGVIGMPANDGTPRVWYMVLDDSIQELKVSHRSFTYDNEKGAALMREKHLPEEYAKTLLTGLWDNCEILPGGETMAQGKEIYL